VCGSLRPLPAGEVHVYYAAAERLLNPEGRTRLAAVLDEQEQQRRERFVFAKDQDLFLVAHGVLRHILSEYLAGKPHQWRFDSNHYGRPEIANSPPGPRLRFNLSHTAGMVVCAVAWERELGVDVEDAQRVVEVEALAPRFFSPQEAQELLALAPSRRQQRFFDYWTLKEAYIKARGMGLSLPLEQFTFHLAAERPIAISFAPPLDDDPARWQFAQHQLEPTFKIAVAAERYGGEQLSIRYKPFELDRL